VNESRRNRLPTTDQGKKKEKKIKNLLRKDLCLMIKVCKEARQKSCAKERRGQPCGAVSELDQCVAISSSLRYSL